MMVSMRAFFVVCSVVGSGLASGGAAIAQNPGASLFDRDRNVSVTQRPRPEYTGGDIQKGAFIFTPQLNLALEFTDNVFGTAANEESDTIAVFNPTLAVESTWSRHTLIADASVTRREYLDFSDESVWNYSLGGVGRLDIQRDTFLESGLRYSSLTEARTSAGAANQAAEPIEYDLFNAFVGGRRALGRILLQGELSLDDVDYEDAPLFGGGIADQDFRDHEQVTGTVRADFALSPDTAVFGRVALNERQYDLTPPAIPTVRDSSGYTFDAGADFDIRGVARGEIGIGYTEQDYDSAALPDVDGLSVDAVLEWFPTQLTTVTVQASREARDAPFNNAGGYFARTASVTVDHELRRNIIVHAGVSLGEDDYADIDRTDERFGANAGVTYFMNRNVGVRASWNYLDQDSSGTAGNQEFARNTVGISLVLHP